MAINYAIISRSIVEISGRYSQVEKDNNRLKILQKATACLNNGENVYFAKVDYRSTNVLPKIYYINSLYFARDYCGKINSKTFAVFNVDDKEEKLEVNLDEIGVNFDKAIVTDVWTGESKIVENTFEVNLLSHGSKLFTVCKYNEPNICDSNCEILNLKASEDSLDFAINYPCQVELVVNFSVKSVVIDGQDVVFAQEKNKLSFENKKKSKISLIF